MEKKNIINIRKSYQAKSDFIPTLTLERGETLQELFNRLPSTIYGRTVECIEDAMNQMRNKKSPDKIVLFYLGECDIVEIPVSGWLLALKNAEKHFRDMEEYEECAKIVELINPLENAITVEFPG